VNGKIEETTNGITFLGKGETSLAVHSYEVRARLSLLALRHMHEDDRDCDTYIIVGMLTSTG
jgi:hypothetical protein